MLVVMMLAEGLQYKQIGRKLGISHRTVESHIAAAMRKSRSRTALELINFVMMVQIT